jgi:hypothetical protein
VRSDRLPERQDGQGGGRENGTRMPDELRRLGRREAYRLGELRTPGVGQPAPPRLCRPSFLPRHRGPASAWVLGFLAGAAAITAATERGLWFVPLLVGVVAGLCGWLGRWRWRVTLPVAAAMALIGWGIPLGLAARHTGPAGAALLGLHPHTTASIAVALVVAGVQALAGACLGRVLAPSVAQWLWLLGRMTAFSASLADGRPGVTRGARVTDHRS